jgi:hypothetical protein
MPRWVFKKSLLVIASWMISVGAHLCAGQVSTPDGPNPQNPWLHHGLLLTCRWYSGSLPGVGATQDQNGNLIGPDGSRNDSVEHEASSAGGVSQSLISCVGKDRVILVCESYTNMKAFGFADPVLQGNPATFAAPVEQCDLWMSPAKLAQMQSDPATNTIVRPCQWKTGDQILDAVSISSAGESGWINHIYERTHGFCLHAAEASTGAAPKLKLLAPGEATAGDTLVTGFDLIDVRTVHTPWADAPMPPWTSQFKTLHYSGQIVSNRGFGARPTQILLDVIRNDSGNDWLSVSTAGGRLYMGQPQFGKKSLFLCGSDQYETFAADPAALARLTPGQVLDTDPFTHIQTRVTQADGNTVTIESASSGADSYRTFDLQTGKVVAFGRVNRFTKFTTTVQLQGQD